MPVCVGRSPRPGGLVSHVWQGDRMPSSDLPDSVFTAFQPVAAALTDLIQDLHLDPLQNAAAAVGQILQQQLADINASIAAVQPAALALASVNADLNQALQAVSRTTAQQMQDALTSINTSMDMTDLARVLQNVQAVQLTDDQWAAASRVLDDAYHSADDSSVADVPDELVDDLAVTARTFAATQEGFGLLTPEVQRQLFAYCCGLMVLFALMQASFTSETADAVIEKAIGLSPALVLTAALAGKAWDTHIRRPEDRDESAADTGGED
ncbi:hypothetical protein FBY37_5649 [Streptomyces sp. SLBN-134]|nr:hypothetical protein FBY37_5649 [Streptomyces sp. SLBN-134]